jgi:hypothetical protein
MRTICRRHGMAESELERQPEGSHIVYGTKQYVLKLFCPLWHEQAEAERCKLFECAT